MRRLPAPWSMSLRTPPPTTAACWPLALISTICATCSGRICCDLRKSEKTKDMQHRFLGVFLAFVLSLLSGSTAAQSTANVHQSTAQPLDGRFEIVQSPIAAKWTFRLDRHSGNVDQLVETQDGALTWQGMLVLDLPDVSSTRTARFAIFASGIAARFTFLIDSQTGRTWVLTSLADTEGSDPPVGWLPFPE